MVEGGIKQLNHNLFAYAGDNPLAKARELSPRTGAQTTVYRENHVSVFSYQVYQARPEIT